MKGTYGNFQTSGVGELVPNPPRMELQVGYVTLIELVLL